MFFRRSTLLTPFVIACAAACGSVSDGAGVTGPGVGAADSGQPVTTGGDSSDNESADSGDAANEQELGDAGSDAADPSDAPLDVEYDTNFDAQQDAGEAAVVLPDGMLTPIPYTSRADSPFAHTNFSYFFLEDWEDGLLDTPGVTSSSYQLGTSFGTPDSVDGDDGIVDGQCVKDGGTCNDIYAPISVEFTFNAAALGGLPTAAGAVWTDGSFECDALFDAYDANDQLIGSAVAPEVGDNSNAGTVGEDRFFGVVHAAGIKRIVLRSSIGGVEVDHLQYGR